MTDVVIDPRVENPANDTESIASGGYFNIRPSKAYVSGGQWVQPVWPTNVTNLSGSAVTVKLDPLPDVPYELFVSLPNGKGKRYEFTEFRIVAGAGPVSWSSLVQVDGPGGGAVLTDVVDARLDALEASVGSVSGGASNLASITNMSPLARLLNADTTVGAMQSRLQVQPTASPVFTTALTAANPTFTGTVTIPDGALAIADTSGLQAALDLKAPLASPALTGTPTVPTATAGTNTTQAASTAFVTTAVAGVSGGGGAPINSPAFTGVPTAPTATAGTSTTQIATTAFATTALNLKAPINDPTFTGSVTLPDPVDPTDAATKNYVDASMAAASPREGNVVAIFGATTARVHPSTGLALDPDTVVLWLTDGTAATNAINGDITLNRATI